MTTTTIGFLRRPAIGVDPAPAVGSLGQHAPGGLLLE